MHRLRHDWCFACPACGFLASTLSSRIGRPEVIEVIDEQRREAALANLRKKNFRRILDRLDAMTDPARRSLLEVGCAHGWFLDAAAEKGYRVRGIEPDAPIAASAASKGHDVAVGFFPDVLPLEARYDIIAFNDVFEHLPDPRAALLTCRQRLHPGGLLVLNLPNSQGAFFRIATLLDRLGIAGPQSACGRRGFLHRT